MRTCRGYTLVEILISGTMLLFTLGLVMLPFQMATQQMTRGRVSIENQQDLRATLDKVVREASGGNQVQILAGDSTTNYCNTLTVFTRVLADDSASVPLSDAMFQSLTEDPLRYKITYYVRRMPLERRDGGRRSADLDKIGVFYREVARRDSLLGSYSTISPARELYAELESTSAEPGFSLMAKRFNSSEIDPSKKWPKVLDQTMLEKGDVVLASARGVLTWTQAGQETVIDRSQQIKVMFQVNNARR
jgi:type II secretory pathway pseudopilin PulG